MFANPRWRLGVPFALVSLMMGHAFAQSELPPPLPAAAPSSPTKAQPSRSGLFAPKWPFKWPKKSKQADPFLGYTSEGSTTNHAAGADSPTISPGALASTAPSTTAPRSAMPASAGVSTATPAQVNSAGATTWGATSPPAASPQVEAGANAQVSASLPTGAPPMAANPVAPIPTQPTNPMLAAKTPDPAGELDENTRLLATVGDQCIIYGDIAGRINEMLAPYKGQVDPKELAVQRELLVQRFLPKFIETKLLFLDLLRVIPPGKFPEVEQDIYRQYNEKQLPEMMEKTGKKTPAELDNFLRGFGSSIAKQQRLFLEQVLAYEAIRTNVKPNKEVSHDELLAYYREHADEFEFEAKAQWERLMVSKARVLDQREAQATLAKMGNEVLRGAPFEAVAKRSSHGPNAAEGGRYDWTTRGSLRSQRLEELIFTLPTGKLSCIIEDDDGYHILRVVERVDAGKQPFTEVQETIREKIQEQRFEEAKQAYLDRLREETFVWIAGEAPAGAIQPVDFQE